jgi:hypothetical protein
VGDATADRALVGASSALRSAALFTPVSEAAAKPARTRDPTRLLVDRSGERVCKACVQRRDVRTSAKNLQRRPSKYHWKT